MAGERFDPLAAFGVRAIPNLGELIEEPEEGEVPPPPTVRAVQWDGDHPRYRKAKRQAQVCNVSAHRRGAEGRVSQQEWIEILEQAEWRCIACKVPSDSLQMSHIRPLAKEGEHVKENVQPLCPDCQRRKGLKIMDFRTGGEV